MIVPDDIQFREVLDTSQGLPVPHLYAHFYHGIFDDERDVALWDVPSLTWKLHPGLETVINYRLAVERINGQARPFFVLCYNCHGLKAVRVRLSNKDTGWQGDKLTRCPTCKGKGIRQKYGVQQELNL